MAKDKSRFDEILIPLYSAISTECYEYTGKAVEWDAANIAHTRRLYSRYGLDGAQKIVKAFYKRLDKTQKQKGWVEPKHMVRHLHELESALTDEEFYSCAMEAVAAAEEIHGEKFVDSERMQQWWNAMMAARQITPFSDWRYGNAEIQQGVGGETSDVSS